MTFGKYGRCKTLAPPFLWSVACARAGIPTMLIAPPSGGKSVVIFAVGEYLEQNGEFVRFINRIGLRGLQRLANKLNEVKTATLLNEEFSSIGYSQYMTEKMGEMIGNIAYSRRYVDDGLKINVKVAKLGFISGVQPLWVSNIMVHKVFATHIREKFIRYYFLPYEPSDDVDEYEAIQTLVERTKEHEPKPIKQIPNEFLYALATQVGITRAKRYAGLIAYELSKLISHDTLSKALRFYAENIRFEQEMVIREIDEHGYVIRTKWREYTALYWCMRCGKIDRNEMALRLGVNSSKSVYEVLNAGIQAGWITRITNEGKVYYTPTEGWKKRRRW